MKVMNAIAIVALFVALWILGPALLVWFKGGADKQPMFK